MGSAVKDASSLITVTMPGHTYQVGDVVWPLEYFNYTDAWYWLNINRTITAVSGDTFSYQDLGGGVSTCACVTFAPRFTISGTLVNGVDGTDDVSYVVTKSRGLLEPGEWSVDSWESAKRVGWQSNFQPTKRYGKVGGEIYFETNSLWMYWSFHQTPRMDATTNQGSFSSGSIEFFSAGWIDFDNYVDPAIITTYQSDVDPNFIIIRVSQLNQPQVGRSFIYPSFEPNLSNTIDLDDHFHGLVYTFQGSVITCRNMGGYYNSIGGLYFDGSNYSYGNRPDSGMYHDTGTYGPVMVGMPLIQGTAPAYYVYPPDFGWVVYRNTLLKDDILEVSPTEKYSIIEASASVALVCRST